MELKAGGFKGRYLAEYLAVGEAPEELRNVLRQRSRWTKGHMQVRGGERGRAAEGREGGWWAGRRGQGGSPHTPHPRQLQTVSIQA
jgi:hypothetical protein